LPTRSGIERRAVPSRTEARLRSFCGYHRCALPATERHPAAAPSSEASIAGIRVTGARGCIARTPAAWNRAGGTVRPARPGDSLDVMGNWYAGQQSAARLHRQLDHVCSSCCPAILDTARFPWITFRSGDLCELSP
jgi:hypothetical protein